jgi:hypothetical protein
VERVLEHLSKRKSGKLAGDRGVFRKRPFVRHGKRACAQKIELPLSDSWPSLQGHHEAMKMGLPVERIFTPSELSEIRLPIHDGKCMSGFRTKLLYVGDSGTLRSRSFLAR